MKYVSHNVIEKIVHILIILSHISWGTMQINVHPVWRRGGTSTVALRVVGGDEKGSLESEAVKYGRETQGTQT
jgi:hypothetical protein